MTETISGVLCNADETPQDTAKRVGSICHASLIGRKDSGLGGRNTKLSPNSTVVS